MKRHERIAHMQTVAYYDRLKTLHCECIAALSPKTLADVLMALEADMADEKVDMSERLVSGLALTAAVGIMLEQIEASKDANR